MAIKVTENALKKLKKLLDAQGVTTLRVFLRIGVKGGGCSGLSYSLDWDTQKEPDDRIFEFTLPDTAESDPKLQVLVRPKSYLYLNGITLDYAEQGLTEGFIFINPNAKSNKLHN